MSHITKININTLKIKFKYLKIKGRKTKTKIQTTNEIQKKNIKKNRKKKKTYDNYGGNEPQIFHFFL